MRVAVLAHGEFPGRTKTAVGFLRYTDRDVVAVLDRGPAGDRVCDRLDEVGDASIVAGAVGASPEALGVSATDPVQSDADAVLDGSLAKSDRA